jgi:hypothetical protein
MMRHGWVRDGSSGEKEGKLGYMTELFNVGIGDLTTIFADLDRRSKYRSNGD